MTKKRVFSLTIMALFLSLMINSCKKDGTETIKLDGAWIENSHKTDTLVFVPEISQDK